MRNSRLKSFTLNLTVLLLGAVPMLGHWISPKEILAALNDPPNKQKTGIKDAKIDQHTSRLLIIKTSKQWAELSKEDRIRNAEAWYKLWSQHVPKGIVSILDGESEEPVIKFSLTGKATLLEPSTKSSDAVTTEPVRE